MEARKTPGYTMSGLTAASIPARGRPQDWAAFQAAPAVEKTVKAVSEVDGATCRTTSQLIHETDDPSLR